MIDHILSLKIFNWLELEVARYGAYMRLGG
jgi:hypothetical protein